jgi:NitT/TauT family transport system substrate-binding protein
MKTYNKGSIAIFIVLLFLTNCTSNQKSENKETSLDKTDQIKFQVAKCTHSVGLCNLPMFISYENHYSERDNTRIQLINIPNWSDHAAALTSGTVDFSVTPFTNVITAYANGAPIRIVSGSGINGLYLVSSKNIKTVKQLKGKKIGTFRADTLEMLLYNLLKMFGLSYDDVEIVYFNDGFEIIQSFASGKIDAMTHVEPYITKAVREFGANRLASGQDVWGGDHPDCVLTASEKIIKDHPEMVKAVIYAMMQSQLNIEDSLDAAINKVVGKYYKTDKEDLIESAKSQPPGIDIRDMKSFILDRFKDLKELGYLKIEPDPQLMNFSFLEEVIHENPELYKKLKFKSKL